MASVLPSSEPALPVGRYGIFFTYHQSNNRSGWITEFVKELNEELAGTEQNILSFNSYAKLLFRIESIWNQPERV